MFDEPKPGAASRLSWSGEVPHQKWMNFYTRVLSRLANGDLKIEVTFRSDLPAHLANGKDEVQAALHEMGLDGNVESSE